MKGKSKKTRLSSKTQTHWKWPITVISSVAVGGLIFTAIWYAIKPSPSEDAIDVTVPTLSTTAVAGKLAFNANCAQCHGENAIGTDKGPPFIHNIYNPGHHSDQAFIMAVRQGVKRHHWPYGDMPSQPQVSDQELAAIIRYVRELQEANGIVYQRHTM